MIVQVTPMIQVSLKCFHSGDCPHHSSNTLSHNVTMLLILVTIHVTTKYRISLSNDASDTQVVHTSLKVEVASGTVQVVRVIVQVIQVKAHVTAITRVTVLMSLGTVPSHTMLMTLILVTIQVTSITIQIIPMIRDTLLAVQFTLVMVQVTLAKVQISPIPRIAVLITPVKVQVTLWQCYLF